MRYRFTVHRTSPIIAARRIVRRHQAAMVQGVILDAYTASMIVEVYRHLRKPANRRHFRSLPVVQAANVALRLFERLRAA